MSLTPPPSDPSRRPRATPQQVDDALLQAAAALTAAVALAVLAGCAPGGGQGTDSGNALTVELSVVGETTTAQQRAASGFDEARMVVNTLEFKSCDASGDEEIDFEGRFETDLLASTTIGSAELAFETVCSLELEAEDEDGPADEPRIFVAGTTDAGAAFEFASVMDIEIELESESPTGFPLIDGINHISAVFDLDSWFGGVDLDAGTPTGDTIFISEADNPTLLAEVEQRILADGLLRDDD